MKDTILAIILKTAFTKPGILRRIRLLREYFEQKYFVTGAKSLTVEKFLEGQKASHDIVLALTTADQKTHDMPKEDVYRLIEDLEKAVKVLPIVGIYLAHEPSDEDIVKLGMWVRQNLNSSAMMELHINRSFLGGCAISYNGTYQEYTLEYFLQQHQEEIKKIIDKYVANKH